MRVVNLGMIAVEVVPGWRTPEDVNMNDGRGTSSV